MANFPEIIPGNGALNTTNESFLGILTPEFTILGIPVQSSGASVQFTFPTDVASSAKILASGLGSGPHTFQDTEAVGIALTTIFNLISRIYDATQGRLVFRDEDITRVPPHEIARRGIARTFQNIELFEHASVLQNLLLGRHAHARPHLAQELFFLPAVRARPGRRATRCSIASRTTDGTPAASLAVSRRDAISRTKNG